MLIIDDEENGGSPDLGAASAAVAAAVDDDDDALDFGKPAAPDRSSSARPVQKTNTASTRITEEVEDDYVPLCFGAVGDSKPESAALATAAPTDVPKTKQKKRKASSLSGTAKAGGSKPKPGKMAQRVRSIKKRSGQREEPDPRSASDIDAEVQQLFKTGGLVAVGLDSKQGEDVTDPATLDKILSWIKAGLILAVAQLKYAAHHRVLHGSSMGH
ncbi:unnamed protein product [Symbiodinium sp. CCMP2592]|nr:unnamed protein product [Symbiodinium sp. CCMP2592]